LYNSCPHFKCPSFLGMFIYNVSNSKHGWKDHKMAEGGHVPCSQTCSWKVIGLTIQKEESCWNAYMFCNFCVNYVPTYYKALLSLPHIGKKNLFVWMFLFSLNLTLHFICMVSFHFPSKVMATMSDGLTIYK
jgi:hypothetical protein